MSVITIVTCQESVKSVKSVKMRGESSNGLWSAIPEADMEAGRPSEAFAERRGI